MPQFDSSTFASQIFWLAVCFTALYSFVSFFVIPRIGQVLDQRTRMIEDDLECAQTLKTEMEELQTAYEAVLSEARNNAREIVRSTQEALSKEAEIRHAHIAAKLSAQVAEAENRIAQAREETVSRVREVAIEAAALATERLTETPLERKAVEAAVNAVSSSGKGREMFL